MNSADLLELYKWLGIVWGGYVSAVILVMKWFSVLPRKWQEESAGRSALIELKKDIDHNRDTNDEEYRELRKELSDQRISATENWIKFLELQKLQSK